ncbi:transmembrane protein 160 isoform X2 [Petromyzon marinus]|uniref:Transmembrane protein 160 isoform X2 n=1 Tax=Petromyzon marinus TaxID=7757 RepID=A0AAJ7TQG0_PETMA|nr:transmembrane protein 160 isoform X2 [Petromyzon marinus]
MSTRLAMPRLPAALRRVIAGTRGGGPGPPRPAGEICPGWWPVLGPVRGDPIQAMVALPAVGPRRESRGLHTGMHYGARRTLQGQGDGPGQQGASPGQRTEARGSSELDRADAWMMRKAQETGYLSWLRNGLLATGIGIIAFVQSDMGREAAYGFFILGGLCISYGTASHMANIAVLRRAMMLSTSAVVLNTVGVLMLAVLWLTAVTLYVGRLEVEIVRDNGGEWDEGCEHCRGHEGEEEGKGRADK